MPFAARGGLIFQRATVPTVPPWQTMTPAEISGEVSTWVLTGTRTLTSSFALGGTIFNTTGAYRKQVLHPNGNVYAAPCTKATNNILEIDLLNSVATEIDTGQTLSGAVRFFSAALGSDGKIYFPPHNFNKVLIVDPPNASYTVQDWGLNLTGQRYSGSVTVGDKIYTMGDKHILVIDTAANTAFTSTYGIMSGTVQFRHVTCTLSIADGCVYWAPYNNTHLIRLDPVSNTMTSRAINIGIQASQGMANGKDGNLYLTRHNNTNSHKFDPIANATTSVGGSSTKSLNSHMGADGNVYSAPFPNATVVDVTSGANGTASVESLSSSYLPVGVERWTTLFAHGFTWTFPETTGNTHVTKTTIDGTGQSSAWSANIALSPYFNTR
jgi:hypothetical protein